MNTFIVISTCILIDYNVPKCLDSRTSITWSRYILFKLPKTITWRIIVSDHIGDTSAALCNANAKLRSLAPHELRKMFGIIRKLCIVKVVRINFVIKWVRCLSTVRNTITDPIDALAIPAVWSMKRCVFKG